MGKTKSEKKDKHKKDSGHKKQDVVPKRPKTAYFLFMDDHREKISKDHMIKNKKGDMVYNMKEVARVLGKQWKELKPEQQETYKQQAAALKLKYLKVMEDYSKDHPKDKKKKKEKKKEKKKRSAKKAAAVSSDSSSDSDSCSDSE